MQEPRKAGQNSASAKLCVCTLSGCGYMQRLDRELPFGFVNREVGMCV